jgi:large subunit ribosomal protein L24
MADKIYKIRIKKGDTVMVRSGKYKGKTGKVLSVQPKLNKVTVEGINVFKRHQKPTQARPQRGIIELTKPIWVSKVGQLDNTAKKASRIGFKIDAKGTKIRVLKTSGKEIK